MTEDHPFPYEIKNVSKEEDELVKKYYKGYIRPFIRTGPAGYFSMAGYGDHAKAIYNLGVRADDIWVVTFSRSGTTWMQELVWLVANNLNFKAAEATSLTKRYAFIEFPTQERELPRADSDRSNTATGGQRATFDDFRTLPSLPSPRYVKSHLPLSLLPPNLLDTSKCVHCHRADSATMYEESYVQQRNDRRVFYVARDPRDVAVSFFFMHKLFRYFDDDVEFEEYWELFKRDLVLHMPISEHVKEAWDKRHHPHLMFVFYEDMQKDLRSVIDRVCVFLGKEYTNAQKEALAEHLSFDNMKKAPIYSTKNGSDQNSEKVFMRKGETFSGADWWSYMSNIRPPKADAYDYYRTLTEGKSGSWVNYFSDDLRKEADDYMEKLYKNTDIRFPEVN